MAVTTTEMLSNQISNWLSQISNDFDLGFVYRPGNNRFKLPGAAGCLINPVT